MSTISCTALPGHHQRTPDLAVTATVMNCSVKRSPRPGRRHDMDAAMDVVPVVSRTRMACLFCGEPERVEIFEIWSHDFMIECCCEQLHETVAREMADDWEWAKTLLRRMGIEELAGHELRRLADDGCCGMTLDWRLRIAPVSFQVAQSFVSRHHAHCSAPVAWRFGACVMNGGTMMGVVMVGNPVARALNGRGILEVNRLCVRRDLPSALAWNCASMLYGHAAKTAKRKGWSRVVTYTRAGEDGTSLIAAGWVQEAVVRGRGWHSVRRGRTNTNAWIDKIRWGKRLRVCPSTQPKNFQDAPPSRLVDALTNRLFATSPDTTAQI